jgi:predicted ATP-grasp superfamily ATP-dependent carboligase
MTDKILNVLIFPAGSGVSKEIFDSLKYIRNINIVGIDSDENNFSYYQFENLILGAPFIKDEEKTVNFIKDIVKKNNIDCIFPAFDSIIVFLKKYEEEIGVKIISSPLETCNICFSKKKTYDLLKNDINVPYIYNFNEVNTFPVFIKPECGYGSRDSLKINDKEELDFYNSKIKDNIICEYLPGQEFTIDCFSSKKNGLIYCEARIREKTVNGLSVLSRHINMPEIKKIGEIISKKLEFIGCWFFQVKYNNNNEITLLEIAPRIPGAACLHRNRGVNFPLLSIYEHFENSIDKILTNDYDISCYKCFENRFKLSIEYDRVYVDLDDTIIIKGKVNTKIIQYLYYIKNINKKIILITRNKDPITYLEKFYINTNIFDEIIKVGYKNRKSDYINNELKSIFIDDSYRERLDVSNNNKIHVFTCDMIECIFDEKL